MILISTDPMKGTRAEAKERRSFLVNNLSCLNQTGTFGNLDPGKGAD